MVKAEGGPQRKGSERRTVKAGVGSAAKAWGISKAATDGSESSSDSNWSMPGANISPYVWKESS